MQCYKRLIPLRGLWLFSKFNRWSCKRYHFSWIQPLLCHLCWLSQLCYKSSCDVQGTGGFCVQLIHMQGCVLSQEVWLERWDSWSGGLLDEGGGWIRSSAVLFLPFLSGNIELSITSGPVFQACLGSTVWKEQNRLLLLFKWVKKPTDNTLFQCYFSVRHKRRCWVKKVNLYGWLPSSNTAAVFVALSFCCLWWKPAGVRPGW